VSRSLFTDHDYGALARLFQPEYGYAGYRPTVLEAPNGVGKVDAQKRYLHVALKYNPPRWAIDYLARAHFEACRVAEALEIPPEFYPRVADGTLRVLDYDPGVGSEEHTDFDLFTVHCYRSTPDDFERLSAVDPRAEAINPHLHLGEIAELIGVGEATAHRVPAREYAQRSIVYFAMPSHGAVLPHRVGAPYLQTVGEWLKERYARSRVYK
jgi:hypothetical protein